MCFDIFNVYSQSIYLSIYLHSSALKKLFKTVNDEHYESDDSLKLIRPSLIETVCKSVITDDENSISILSVHSNPQKTQKKAH